MENPTEAYMAAFSMSVLKGKSSREGCLSKAMQYKQMTGVRRPCNGQIVLEHVFIQSRKIQQKGSFLCHLLGCSKPFWVKKIYKLKMHPIWKQTTY